VSRRVSTGGFDRGPGPCAAAERRRHRQSRRGEIRRCRRGLSPSLPKPVDVALPRGFTTQIEELSSPSRSRVASQRFIDDVALGPAGGDFHRGSESLVIEIEGCTHRSAESTPSPPSPAGTCRSDPRRTRPLSPTTPSTSIRRRARGTRRRRICPSGCSCRAG
jgi:hypothetical protein